MDLEEGEVGFGEEKERGECMASADVRLPLSPDDLKLTISVDWQLLLI